jgi:miniconductance mechanosensitive channel
MENFNINHWSREWLESMNLSPESVEYFTLGIDLVLLILISILADFIARRIILRFVGAYVKRSRNKYDDVFLEKKVFRSLAHLVPATIIWNALPAVFEGTQFDITWLRKGITIYMIIMIMVMVNRFLKALAYLGLQSERFEGKPVNSYIQVFSLVNYILGTVIILSMLIGKSPLAILTAFGAATAVLLLIFRDTILGLVASIQISANDMVRLGDWVSMEKYGADGDVIEINLTTVKIRNFDKTITTVPTYAFISDSFKNWRGMQSQGVRRIKRAINIDINSVQFVDDDWMKRFTKYQRISDYVSERQSEIDTYNQEHAIDTSELINGRHMTNIGVFRRYALEYLMSHPQIAQKQTVMVRQLEPNTNGVPIEIYCFSNDIAWVNYEGIQADIFDHLLSAVNHFGLRIFQNPSGQDLRSLNQSQD